MIERGGGWYDDDCDGCQCLGTRRGWDELMTRLADGVYPIPRQVLFQDDARRFWHDDLPEMSDWQLDFDLQRVTVRACLRPQAHGIGWLHERRQAIFAEQERRATERRRQASGAWTRRLAEEREREQDRRQYEEWQRWQALQRVTMPEADRAASDDGPALRVIAGGGESPEQRGTGSDLSPEDA